MSCDGKCIERSSKHQPFMICNDCFEARLTENYELGQVAAAEELPERFLTMAGDAFRNGIDDKALMLRSLAKEFAQIAIAKRDAYREKYRLKK